MGELVSVQDQYVRADESELAALMDRAHKLLAAVMGLIKRMTGDQQRKAIRSFGKLLLPDYDSSDQMLRAIEASIAKEIGLVLFESDDFVVTTSKSNLN